ncbi:hybrid non-ribosomal peptide synthetase/type I polyketide synthase [Brevibacillus sp. NSP2.1]|uniref:hybrid non-ribosomal peptide synthetase/type I polyketide synthase n=1 Tax=Brevibacillus sp. NSP2.1 TaxID=3003229 RepID=UPI0003FFCCE8|nr:hybrid non-ribosomal peptide synthetase/type I polyketide synthase [Brevibacillus sp. NSP2.1]QHZ56592.1 hybrid non-ribosomal peptide synthetase/type I polyketide synthase [Brevibacillus sp. NSP2.1]
MADTRNFNGLEIAVIGLACRFPGANNRQQFWNNLKDGLESITFFSDDELRAEGVPQELIEHENYVKAGATLDQFEYFDERFFGYSPKDALVMDPQVRLFHEVAWEAMEDAGYVPDSYAGLVGVFAGASSNYNWNARVYAYEGEHRDLFSEIQLSNKDFLASRISYKFNLKGPSLTLTTACSTSLTAIHAACRSLLSGECDMAIAGGCSILIPHKSGYLYEEGHFLSKNGQIRAFDEAASGILFGNGVGVVVLKPLENALADKDHIWAIIKGSAVNNDGNRKAGYMAPSVEGQKEVIQSALQLSDVEPESISYVETHGTGTQLGDSIEFTALKQVFRERQSKCVLGSVKNNIGHLDAASGVAGFMKTVLALKHRQIPPMINFARSNPALDMENSPFVINTTLQEWSRGAHPLRAGISSFGVGGQNAHLIVEEAPESRESADDEEQPQLVLLSAQNSESLAKMADNLAKHIAEHPEIRLRDVAYTLQKGRKSFEYRRQIVCESRAELIRALTENGSRQSSAYRADGAPGQIVFLFSGQGSQYVNMGQELYEKEQIFRESLDHCFALLKRYSPVDYRSILFPREEQQEQARQAIASLDHGQVILFVFEYALARLLMAWGIHPDAVIGYSLGEYIAATIAGLFTLEQALQLVLKRGELFRRLPDGKMLSIPLSVAEVMPFLSDSLEIAIDNQTSCVVGGPTHLVLELEEKLRQDKRMCTPLPFPKVIHTSRVEAILDDYQAVFQPVAFQELHIPFLSSVTGDWAEQADLAGADYWLRQLKDTVQFTRALQTFADRRAVLIEIGPGHDLSALAKRAFDSQAGAASAPGQKILNLIPYASSNVSVRLHLYKRLGKLWQYGVNMDWDKINPHGKRIPLPTYPFVRKKFWLDAPVLQPQAANEPQQLVKKPFKDWYYVPSWKRHTPVFSAKDRAYQRKRRLIFAEQSTVGELLAQKVRQLSEQCITVYKSGQRQKIGDGEFAINPGRDEDYDWLFQQWKTSSFTPDEVIHMWSLGDERERSGAQSGLEAALDNGYYSLLAIAKEWGKHFYGRSLELKVLANGVCAVADFGGLNPYKSLLLGPIRVIPLEYPAIRCSLFDSDFQPEANDLEKALDSFVQPFLAQAWNGLVSYQNKQFWLPTHEPVSFAAEDSMELKPGGTYLITGGLGGIGLAIADFLAQQAQATLILVGRTLFPPKETWLKLLAANKTDDEVSRTIRRLCAIEQAGGSVQLMQADISDKRQVEALLKKVDGLGGQLNGVIHAAGVADGEMIQRATRESAKKLLAAKVDGTTLLYEAVRDRPLDFLILFSSLSAYIPSIGQTGYCAANAFLDSFANYCHGNKSHFPVVSINWERWKGTGMARQIEEKHRQLTGEELAHAITEAEGIRLFSRIGATSLPQVAVSAYDLNELVARYQDAEIPFVAEGFDDRQRGSAETYVRPDLTTEYVAPRDEREQQITAVWEAQFGVQPIGVHDSLFELGGDSIMALSIVGKIQKLCNERIPMAYFLHHPTVAGLSAYLQQTSPQQAGGVHVAPRKDHYPLTSVQKRVYFLQKMHPHTTVYNNPGVYQLDGDVDVGTLQAIFQKLIERHEIFRTSFGFAGQEVVQTVQTTVPFAIEELALPEEGMAAAISAFIRPFEPEKAPLIRVGYERSKKLLLIDMHHLISDETSYQLLIRDFLAVYKGEELPALPVQYKDYAEWHAALRDTPAFAKQKAYWLGQFANGEHETKLQLPTDFKPPLVQSFAGDFLSFRMDARTTERFKRMLKQEAATLNMGLLALYAVLLSKMCQQETIIVGTPVSGRKQTELENVIGPFVDTVALKLHVDAAASFSQLLQLVKQTISAALDHQDYPFEELISSLDIQRDLSRNPLFETMFSFRDVYDKTDQIGGVQEITSFYKHKTAMFSIRFTAWEEGAQIGCELEYSTKLFAKETVERMARYFAQLMQGVVDEPDAALSAVEIMSEHEKQQVLVGFNQTRQQVDASDNVVSLFGRQAKTHPDKAAVTLGESSLSYRELDEATNRLARYLQKRGVTREQPVGIYTERSLEMVIAMLAVLKAEGAYVPLDASIPFQRVQQIREEAGIDVMISTSDLLTHGKLGCQSLVLLDQEWSEIRQESSLALSSAIEPAQTAYIIFTSGSTGKPKGVMVPHRALNNFLLSMASEPGMTARDKLLSVTTFSFDIFGLELFLPLIAGATAVLASKTEMADGKQLSRLLETHGITVMQATPATWKMLLRSGWAGSPHLKALCGGESLPTDLAKEMLGKTGSFWNMYGPTETTIWSTIAEITDAGQQTIGKPIANTQVYILDNDKKPVPVGVYGEMYIGGIGVAAGYVNNPALTAERFVANPFEGDIHPVMYRTGDIARFLADGTIQCAGRIDDQVKIRGFRIELSEIKAVISSYPGICDNVVVLDSLAERAGTSNRADEKGLTSYLVLVAGASVQIEELKNFLLERLPAYMIPQQFFVIEKIPLNHNRKVDRKQLKSLQQTKLVSARPFRQPTTEAEEQLVAIWKKLLHLEEISTSDSYFDLGGTSLAVVLMQEQIKERFQIELHVADIFTHPTIERLAACIESTISSAQGEERRGISLPAHYFLSASDPGESIPLALELPQATAKGLFQIARLHEMQIEEVMLALLFYLLKQVANEESIAIHLLDKREQLRQVTVDFSGMTDFDSLFMTVKESIREGRHQPLLSAPPYRAGREQDKTMLLLYPLIPAASRGATSSFNAVWGWEVGSGERINIYLEYDSLLFKATELKKWLQGFAHLAKQLVSRVVHT